MTTNDCNCGPEASKEYLMVKVTPSEASTCGTGEVSTTKDCAKQEDMFDKSLSSFTIPVTIGSTNMEVCNAGIYTVDMWLQFLDPVATLKISAITGKILTLINRCDSGDAISFNPDAGTAIDKGTKFIVCDSPPCYSEEERAADIENSLKTMTGLCMPDLQECSETAIIQPVGRISSDPEDLSVKKCIKRIFGILFKAGSPYLSSLRTADPVDVGNYNRLVRHKGTDEVRKQLNYCDSDGLNVQKQYLLSITNGDEAVRGPCYLTKLVQELVEVNTESFTAAAWPTFTEDFEKDFDLSDITGLNVPGNDDSFLDHYYVMARLEFETYTDVDTNRYTTAKLNGLRVGRCLSRVERPGPMSVSVPIKILKSDHKLTLKFVCESYSDINRFYYNLNIDGIYF